MVSEPQFLNPILHNNIYKDIRSKGPTIMNPSSV